MARSSQLSVATHVVVMLADVFPNRLTSDQIAASVNTNPVVIRRLLKKLATAGLVESHMGPGGGVELRIPPGDVTLGDIFRATLDGPLVNPAPSIPSAECPVGRSIQATIASRVDGATQSFEKSLDRATLQSLVADVRQAR